MKPASSKLSAQDLGSPPPPIITINMNLTSAALPRVTLPTPFRLVKKWTSIPAYTEFPCATSAASSAHRVSGAPPFTLQGNHTSAASPRYGFSLISQLFRSVWPQSSLPRDSVRGLEATVTTTSSTTSTPFVHGIVPGQRSAALPGCDFPVPFQLLSRWFRQITPPALLHSLYNQRCLIPLLQQQRRHSHCPL